MLKRLCVSNFYSFKDAMEVNFQLGGKVPAEFRKQGDINTVMGIKGANGSGKTNIIKALSFLKNFCHYSFRWDNKDAIPLESWFDSQEPVSFLVEFSFDQNDYAYELEITPHEVLGEALYKTTRGRQKLIERQGTEIVEASADYQELKKIKLKPNGSVIGVLESYNFDAAMPELENFSNFFLMILNNVSPTGFVNIDEAFEDAPKKYYENPELLSFVARILKIADNGIDNIHIEKTRSADGKELYIPKFTHLSSGIENELYLHQQSSGTQSLFKRMNYYAFVLGWGGILALDEFDIHLHALILPELINLFLDKDTNPRNAQLIFTAHNTEVLDTLGKYRTILVNKEQNESYCYRLDDIPGTMVRNDRSIVPLYLQGKIGGIPGE